MDHTIAEADDGQRPYGGRTGAAADISQRIRQDQLDTALILRRIAGKLGHAIAEDQRCHQGSHHHDADPQKRRA